MINQALSDADSKMSKAVEVTREEFTELAEGAPGPLVVP